MNFFTADLHFNHSNIMKYVPRISHLNEEERSQFDSLFASGDARMRDLTISQESVERMNTSIIDSINAVVMPGDILWCLGDVYFGDSIEQLKELRSRINCRTIKLVLGNHDKNILRWHPYRSWGNATVLPGDVMGLKRTLKKLASKKIGGSQALSTANNLARNNPLKDVFDTIVPHATIKVGGQKIVLNHCAQIVWDGSHKGAWHLYGHSHGNFEPFRMTHFPDARMMDVGIDWAYIMYGDYRPFSMDDLGGFMNKKRGMAIDHHNDSLSQFASN